MTDGESFRGEDGRITAGWRTALASLVGLSVSPSVLQVMSLGVFAPHLRDEFGWGLAQISLAAMILAIMTTFVSPLQGLLVDRYGARRLILISMPLFSLGYAALSLMSGNLGQFYLIWGVLPLLGVGLWPASWVKATSSWFDKRLGLAIGVATVGIGIGAALLPMQIDLIARTQGWRSAFAGIGVASLLVAWPLAFLFVRDRERSSRRGAVAPAEETNVPARRSTFLLLFIAFLLLGVFSTSILLHLINILGDNGMSPAAAVTAQSVLGAAMIVGRLGSGFIVDRISVRIVMPMLIALAVGALALLAGGAGGGIAILSAALIGLLIGAEIDVLGFVLKRYFGSWRYGTLYGVLFSVFQLGGALGVFAMGAAREAGGSYGPGLGALMLACIGAGSLFGLLGPYRFGYEPSARLARGDSMTGAPSIERA